MTQTIVYVDKIYDPADRNRVLMLRPSATRSAYMGTCSTGGTTAAKVITVESFPVDRSNKPLTGTIIGVLFTSTNTVTNPTFTVNTTIGPYQVWYDGAAIAASTSPDVLNKAGYDSRYIYYVWDGTYWAYLSWSYENTSFSRLVPGLVPAPGSAVDPEDLQYIYLRGDGTWENFSTAAIGACSGEYLPLAGGTMSGDIDGLPTSMPSGTGYRTHVVSVGMLEDNYLNLDGSSPMGGDISMQGEYKVTDMGEPTDPSDAATKRYVDNLVGNNWGTADALASNADGLKTVQWLYTASGGTVLEFTTNMAENSTCHLFVKGGSGNGTFGSGSLTIKYNTVPKSGGAGNYDTVIIDNAVKFKNGTIVDTTNKVLSISANQILEVSVMYTTIMVGSTKYYRTIIKTAAY